MTSTNSTNMDMEEPKVTTSDVKPLLGRVLNSRTRLEWALIAVTVILAILSIVLIAGYSHCRDSVDHYKSLAEDLSGPGAVELEGDQCKDLSGVWYNNLGSEMIINVTHGKKGFLFGEYRTAVERTPGAAGESHSILVGANPLDYPGSTFAFSVMWSDGASMTTWTGQCLSCNGKETLITSWMLRSRQEGCGDVWKSTRVGQDVFTRDEQVSGGKRTDMTTYEPSQELLDVMKWKPNVSLDSGDLHKKGDGLCDLDGPWVSDTETELALTHEHGYIIEGRYRTTIEHIVGLDKSVTHSLIYGIGNRVVGNTTVALFLVHERGAAVTGFTGQCHVCGTRDDPKEVLETAWMHRKQVTKCPDNWRATLYGQTSFNRGKTPT